MSSNKYKTAVPHFEGISGKPIITKSPRWIIVAIVVFITLIALTFSLISSYIICENIKNDTVNPSCINDDQQKFIYAAGGLLIIMGVLSIRIIYIFYKNKKKSAVFFSSLSVLIMIVSGILMLIFSAVNIDQGKADKTNEIIKKFNDYNIKGDNIKTKITTQCTENCTAKMPTGTPSSNCDNLCKQVWDDRIDTAAFRSNCITNCTKYSSDNLTDKNITNLINNNTCPGICDSYIQKIGKATGCMSDSNLSILKISCLTGIFSAYFLLLTSFGWYEILLAEMPDGGESQNESYTDRKWFKLDGMFGNEDISEAFLPDPSYITANNISS